MFGRLKDQKCFNEGTVATIMAQLFSALAYCHDNRIVHRDLKPENVLFASKDPKDFRIKLIDFGTAEHLKPGAKLKEKIGTPYYIAPEVIKCSYDEKCDIWSSGIIMYTLLCGKPPFLGADDDKIMKLVLQGAIFFKRNERIIY